MLQQFYTFTILKRNDGLGDSFINLFEQYE